MLRWMKDRSCSPTDYRVVIPGNGANVGTPRHPRLAIGSTVLTSNRGLNPLSIQGHGPNRWAWKLFSTGERTMTYCDPRALAAHTHTHTHTPKHTHKYFSFPHSIKCNEALVSPLEHFKQHSPTIAFLCMHTKHHGFSSFNGELHTHTPCFFNRARRLF